MPGQATLAITARGCGSRWYGRVSVPYDVAKQAGIAPGARVSAICAEGTIVIRVDEHGRIRFPEARGRQGPRHAFEAATRTLGLKEHRLPQAVAPTEIGEGEIRIKVPEESLASESRTRARPRRERPRTVARGEPPAPRMLPSSKGAAGAVEIEAARTGRKVRTFTIPDLVEFVASFGPRVEVCGPRLFRMDGRTVSAADLVEAANRLAGSTDHDRIMLVLD